LLSFNLKKKEFLVMRLKLLFCGMIVLFFSGCGTAPQKPVDIEEFENKHAALVIMKGSFLHRGMLRDSKHGITYDFARVDDHYFEPKNKFFYRSHSELASVLRDMKGAFSKEPGYDIFFIEPGSYVLENIHAEVGKTKYRSDLPGLDRTNNIAYGSFDVLSGESIYLGDVQFEWDGKRKRYLVTVKDEHKNAEEFLGKSYKQALPLKTRLVQASLDRGTVIQVSQGSRLAFPVLKQKILLPPSFSIFKEKHNDKSLSGPMTIYALDDEMHQSVRVAAIARKYNKDISIEYFVNTLSSDATCQHCEMQILKNNDEVAIVELIRKGCDSGRDRFQIFKIFSGEDALYYISYSAIDSVTIEDKKHWALELQKAVLE